METNLDNKTDQNSSIFDKTFSELENLKTDEQDGCNLLDLLTDVSSPETFSVEKEEKKYFGMYNCDEPKTKVKNENTPASLDFTSFFKEEEEQKKIEKNVVKKNVKNLTTQQQQPSYVSQNQMLLQQQQLAMNMMKQQQTMFQTVPQAFYSNPYMNFYNFQQPGAVQMIPSQNLFFQQQQQQQMMNYQKVPTQTTMVNNGNVKQQVVTNVEQNRKRKRGSPVINSTSVETPLSFTSSPINEKNGPLEKDDKEIKRKKRLIKNRQSAQASRERKKMYVKGLEKSVNNLTNEQSALKSKLTELEKENELLRLKLAKAETGEDVGPLPKKRKYEYKKVEETKKVPIPSNATYYGMKIPFMQPMFWNNFFNGGQMEGMDKSPKVVLFIALFCIALFFFPNLLNKAHMEPKRVSLANRVLLQKINQNLNDKLFMKNFPGEYKGYFVDKITALQKEIGGLNVKANQTEFEAATTELKTKIDDILGDVRLDWKDDDVEFIFPSSKNPPVVVNGKSIKSEEETVKSRKISISKEFLSEICNQLGGEGETKK